MANEKFWMVKKAGDNHGTKICHYSKDEAMNEAERLAKSEKCRFYVLETISYCEPADTPVKWYSQMILL